ANSIFSMVNIFYTISVNSIFSKRRGKWGVLGEAQPAQNTPHPALLKRYQTKMKKCIGSKINPYCDVLTASSQKEGGSGVFWAGHSPPKTPHTLLYRKDTIN
ncbi:MAG: hypothetical protein M1485_05810, partial [Chloroflexi bacterium]|nr:hypothetical protein [Chloroflexota bacterium]